MSQQPPLPPPGSNPYGDPVPPRPDGQQPPFVPLPPVQQPLWQGQQAPIEGQPWPAQQPPAPRRRRSWFWPALALVVTLVVALGVALAIVLTRDDAPEPLRVADLEVGDCLTSDAIAADDVDVDDLAIDDLAVVACSATHHGTVFATFEAGAGVSDLNAAGRRCGEEFEAGGRSLAEITAAGQELRPLTTSDEVDAGTRVVCFLRNSDGSALSGGGPSDTDPSTTTSNNPTSTED